MPRTRWERLIFVLGVVALAGLLYGVVHARKSAATTRPAPPATATAPPAPTTTTALPTTTAPATTSTASTTPRATTAPPATAATQASRSAALTLTAARGASWVEVRAGSSTGSILYAGVLASGQSVSFQRPTLWTRFGAGANLDAILNGKAVQLPHGTYSVTITPSGLGHTHA